jgi:transposase
MEFLRFSGHLMACVCRPRKDGVRAPNSTSSPEEFGREAVQLLRAGRTPRELAESLGVSQQTLRNWRRQDERDRHERDDGVTSDEREELRRLRRENVRLKQERDLLKQAAAFFAAETETR